MSDWNQLPNWDPLGWAQLTEEKRQNNYNNFTRPWQQAVDLFSKYFTQQNEQGYQVNKLLPAQTSAAIETATAQNALPMTDYQSQSLGVQKEQAEKANSIQERIAKYQEEMLAAQTDEEKKRLQAEIDKLNLELITARQDYQNSLAGIKGADKQTTYKSAMDDFFGKIFADQNYGVTRDPITGQYDFSQLRKNTKAIDAIVNQFGLYAKAIMDKGDIPAAQAFVRSYLMGYQEPTTAPGQAPQNLPATPGKGLLETFGEGGQGSPYSDPAMQNLGMGIVDLFRNLTSPKPSQTAGAGATPPSYNILDFKTQDERVMGKINKQIFYKGKPATKEQLDWYYAHGGK